MERLQISIPKPCHQDWNQMTPAERGRFCTMCNKTVLDFSNKTEEEIRNFITLHRNENLCGRFRSDQLTAPKRIELPLPAYLSRTSFVNVFIMALLFCFGTALFSCNTPADKPVKTSEQTEIVNSDRIVLGGITFPEEPIAKPETQIDSSEAMVMGDFDFGDYQPPEFIGPAESIVTGEVEAQPDTAAYLVYTVGGIASYVNECDDSPEPEPDSVATAERIVPDGEEVVSVPEENFFSLVYPNPSDGLLNIEFQSSEQQYIQLDLFDESGRLIRNLFSRQLLQPGKRTIQVDVSNQPPGIYLVRIAAGEKVKTEPVIIAGR